MSESNGLVGKAVVATSLLAIAGFAFLHQRRSGSLVEYSKQRESLAKELRREASEVYDQKMDVASDALESYLRDYYPAVEKGGKVNSVVLKRLASSADRFRDADRAAALAHRFKQFADYESYMSEDGRSDEYPEGYEFREEFVDSFEEPEHNEIAGKVRFRKEPFQLGYEPRDPELLSKKGELAERYRRKEISLSEYNRLEANAQQEAERRFEGASRRFGMERQGLSAIKGAEKARLDLEVQAEEEARKAAIRAKRSEAGRLGGLARAAKMRVLRAQEEAIARELQTAPAVEAVPVAISPTSEVLSVVADLESLNEFRENVYGLFQQNAPNASAEFDAYNRLRKDVISSISSGRGGADAKLIARTRFGIDVDDPTWKK